MAKSHKPVEQALTEEARHENVAAPSPCYFVCSANMWWPQGCSSVSGYYCPESEPAFDGDQPKGSLICSEGSITTFPRSSLPAKARGDVYYTEYRFDKGTFYMIGGKAPPPKPGTVPDYYCAPNLPEYSKKDHNNVDKLKKIVDALEASGLIGTIVIEWNASIAECKQKVHKPSHK